MKYALVGIGTLGDVLPMIWLGRKLRARGDTVVVFASDAFEALIRGAGLGFASLGTLEAYNAALSAPLYDRELGWHAVCEHLFVPQLRAFHAYNTASLCVVAQPHLELATAARVYLQPYAAQFFPPGQHDLALFPQWFAPEWSFAHFEGFPTGECGEEPGTLFDEFEASPVYVTFGSANVHATPLIQETIETLAELGRPALIVTRFAEALPPLPAQVRVVEQILPSRALPHCAAIVHHGGIGTVAVAHAAGTHQVIVPLAHDQFDNAQRAQRTMGARVIERARLREQLAEALT